MLYGNRQILQRTSMNDFIRVWRQPFAFVWLLFALFVSGCWVRSWLIHDCIHILTFMAFSRNGQIYWRFTPLNTLGSRPWFGFGIFISASDYNQFYTLAYWLIAAPSLLVYAYLVSQKLRQVSNTKSPDHFVQDGFSRE